MIEKPLPTQQADSVASLSGVNTWLYSDGGLNDISINSYYLKNENTLQQNNYYVANLNPNSVEYEAYLVGRGLGALNNKPKPFGHEFDIITGSPDYLNNYIKEYNLKNNLSLSIESIEIYPEMEEKGIKKNETNTHFLTFGGYRGGHHTNAKDDGSENGFLTKDINSPDDLKFLQAGKFESKEIVFKTGKQEDNERNMVEAYVSYNNTANYPEFIVGVPNSEYVNISAHRYERRPESQQTYNSNSFANTLCISSGGINCNTPFEKIYPGDNKPLPNDYFKKN